MSSPNDSGKKTPATLADRDMKNTEPGQAQYFPEDERSPLEKEDDHSHTDFDLDAEIAREIGGKASGSSSPASPGDLHFPDAEDIRPCYDGEEDHSTSDIDLDAEIEAKLGKAPEEGLSEVLVDPSAGPSVSQTDDSYELAEDFHDPEDLRPCYEGEQDHSVLAFDLDAEIDAQLKKREEEKTAYAASLTEAVSTVDEHHDGLHLEDERSPMDWEDDHSHADPASPPHLSQDGSSTSEEASTNTAENPNNQTNGSAALPEESDSKDMHPDLAASFTAFQSFQGTSSPLQEEADSGGAPGVDDDSPPSDSDEICTDDDCVPVDEENSDGSMSESGYLAPATAGAAAGALYAQDEKKDEQEALRDKPLSSTAVDGGTEDQTGAPGGNADNILQDNGNDGEDGKEITESTPPALASGGDGKGNPPDEDDDEEDSGDQPMTLRDHLRELRKRLLRAFLWMLGGFLLCYPFNEKLFTLLMEPLIKVMPKTSHFIFTNPPEAFFTYLKVAFVAGIFIASPMVFYQIWAFVAPGLYKEEKVYIVPVAFCSALFFMCGGAFCYFIGLPFVFEFFMSYNTGLIQAMPSLKETLSFVLQLLLAFGLVFELPLFIFFLSRLGIVTADMMRRFRRYSLLLNIIVAAILTPPDVMSQMLMAGPLVILYEISIIIAAIFGKKKQDAEQAAEDEEDEDDENDSSPAPEKS